MDPARIQVPLELPADDLVRRLLYDSRSRGLCLLDSCGRSDGNDHLLIAGIFPAETVEVHAQFPDSALDLCDDMLTSDRAAVFTLSYDLGRRLAGGKRDTDRSDEPSEPDIFISLFDCLLIHDYSTGLSFVTGDPEMCNSAMRSVAAGSLPADIGRSPTDLHIRSNFTKAGYIDAIRSIKEHIRSGNTYQTNLTQQLTVRSAQELHSPSIFRRLRERHPAPFAAFIERQDSTVISASPERFFRIDGGRIRASPIKGTRPRGRNAEDDRLLRDELRASEKDRAENTMIVDLMRNDLGRVCKYGSVTVTELCAIQELPSLFHLVSTVEGELVRDIKPSQVIEALFPCGSITGAPKIRTMQIIDELEPSPRGLSMGAVGVWIPEGKFGLSSRLDLSVAIRTMVVRADGATFNVGGGIVIDSDPELEYRETLLKARALLDSLGVMTMPAELPGPVGNFSVGSRSI